MLIAIVPFHLMLILNTESGNSYKADLYPFTAYKLQPTATQHLGMVKLGYIRKI